MKSSLTSLVNQKIQIKTTVRYYYNPEIKETDYTKCWGKCKTTKSLLHCWWECKLVQSLWKFIQHYLLKLFTGYFVTQKFSQVYAQENAYIHTLENMQKNASVPFICTGSKLETTQWLSSIQQINRVVCMQQNSILQCGKTKQLCFFQQQEELLHENVEQNHSEVKE